MRTAITIQPTHSVVEMQDLGLPFQGISCHTELNCTTEMKHNLKRVIWVYPLKKAALKQNKAVVLHSLPKH